MSLLTVLSILAHRRHLVEASSPCTVELATPEASKAWMPDAAMASCTAIKITGSPLHELGGMKLRPMLSRAEQLESLDLSHMELGDMGVKEVANALRGHTDAKVFSGTGTPCTSCSSKLKQLHLEHNSIGSTGAVALAASTDDDKLRKHLIMPQGLLCASNGIKDVLFICSAGARQIVVLDANKLTLLFQFGQSTASDEPLLKRPTDLAIYHTTDAAGRATSHLYVCDSLNHRLAVFSTDGDFVRVIGSFGKEPGMFHEPLGITIRSDPDSGRDKVFVCEGIGARLQVLSPDGTPLLVLPSPTGGRLVGCAWWDNRLYVSEIEAHRIHVFRIIEDVPRT